MFAALKKNILMKFKFILSVIVISILFAFSLQAQDAPFIKQAETGFFPVTKSGFNPQVSIAPQIAYMSFSDLGLSGIGYGAEIALQCPLACTKKNYIRQQISFLAFSEDDYSYWTAGINPEYRLFVKPEFEFAVGPTVGYFNSQREDDSSSGINYGVSSSVTVHLGKVFIAVAPRYVLSKDIELLDSEFSQNHFQGVFKLGYKL